MKLIPRAPEILNAEMNWNSPYIGDLVRRALEEDVGAGDVTAEATIPERAAGKARILAREPLVCAGLPLAAKVFLALDAGMRFEAKASDGDRLQEGDELLKLAGNARAILTGERTALNFLARLCGIATLTGKFVEQLAGTKVQLRDTRKTTPGLRTLEKYAVKVGGGTNHRMGLYDAILLKENHIALAGGIRQALDKAHAYAASHAPSRAMTAYEELGSIDQSKSSAMPVQIEVRGETELREALESGAESVLLDNMLPAGAKRCVDIVRSVRPECIVEISGGITLENARAYAETSANYLSSGMLTHSAPAANLSLLVDSIEDK